MSKKKMKNNNVSYIPNFMRSTQSSRNLQSDDSPSLPTTKSRKTQRTSEKKKNIRLQEKKESLTTVSNDDTKNEKKKKKKINKKKTSVSTVSRAVDDAIINSDNIVSKLTQKKRSPTKLQAYHNISQNIHQSTVASICPRSPSAGSVLPPRSPPRIDPLRPICPASETSHLTVDGFDDKDRNNYVEDLLDIYSLDLAEWFSFLLNIDLSSESFMRDMNNGILLCKFANQVEVLMSKLDSDKINDEKKNKLKQIIYHQNKSGAFFARDNVIKFQDWCRELGVNPCLMFCTNDVVEAQSRKRFLYCLMEVGRLLAAKGICAPSLVELEREIDSNKTKSDNDDSNDNLVVISPPIMNDLARKVQIFVDQCGCNPKTKVTICKSGVFSFEFPPRSGVGAPLIKTCSIRESHRTIMARVGGGWETLAGYLSKFDNCRIGYSGNNKGKKKRRKIVTNTDLYRGTI